MSRTSKVFTYEEETIILDALLALQKKTEDDYENGITPQTRTEAVASMHKIWNLITEIEKER